MTSEERLASLHTRMAALGKRQKIQERQKTAALGAGCGMLAAYLTWLFFSEGIGSPRGTAGPYSGAAMLFENAGGYVTTAVAAFMAGVIIAAACIRYRQKQKRESGPDGIRQADSQGKASATKDSNGGEN